MKIEGKSKPGQLLTTRDIKITEGDQEVKGAASAAIFMDPNDLVEVRIKLRLEDISLSEVSPHYVITHPITAQVVGVADIKLKDGTYIIKDGVIKS